MQRRCHKRGPPSHRHRQSPATSTKIILVLLTTICHLSKGSKAKVSSINMGQSCPLSPTICCHKSLSPPVTLAKLVVARYWSLILDLFFLIWRSPPEVRTDGWYGVRLTFLKELFWKAAQKLPRIYGIYHNSLAPTLFWSPFSFENRSQLQETDFTVSPIIHILFSLFMIGPFWAPAISINF